MGKIFWKNNMYRVKMLENDLNKVLTSSLLQKLVVIAAASLLVCQCQAEVAYGSGGLIGSGALGSLGDAGLGGFGDPLGAGLGGGLK